VQAISDGVCLWQGDQLLIWNRAARQMTRQDAPEGALHELLSQQREGTAIVSLPLSAQRSLEVELHTGPTSKGLRLQTFRDVTGDQRLRRLKNDFMATAAHELRTPLTSIYGFAQTLKGSDLGESDQARFTEIIVEQSEQMTRILDAFQQSLQADDLVAERHAVDLKQVLATWPDLRVSDAPPCPAVLADPQLLRDVLQILYDNALRYGRAPVTVSCHSDHGEVRIYVSDEGEGIDPEAADHLFDAFFRLDAQMQRHAGGLGLGLYRARNMALAMGGNLTLADDDPDAPDVTGAVFCLTLPRAI
jgi:two-component system phosphate regulon sensor histidine kinase PhoR